MSLNPWLVASGSLSSLAALLHLAIVAGGSDWYRFFGAGEPLARAAARGSPIPALYAVGIACLLGIAAAYAFAGAGLIRRLPLLRTGLIVISAVLLARGLVILSPSTMGRPDLSDGFMLYSSLIVLVLGLTYAVGTWQAWHRLSERKAA